MANYYMLGGDGKEYGPVSADQLRQWTSEGRANAQTQVRASDGSAYVSLGMVPDLMAPPTSTPVPATTIASTPKFFTPSPTAADTDASAQTKRLASVVAAGSVWMKLLATAMFLLTALLCVTIVGLLVAWLPLWQGINFWSASNLAQHALYSGSETALLQSLDKIRRSFMLGFFMVVAFGVLYLIVSVIGLMMGGMSAFQNMGGGSF